jgi:hypothetical protein
MNKKSIVKAIALPAEIMPVSVVATSETEEPAATAPASVALSSKGEAMTVGVLLIVARLEREIVAAACDTIAETLAIPE